MFIHYNGVFLCLFLMFAMLNPSSALAMEFVEGDGTERIEVDLVSHAEQRNLSLVLYFDELKTGIIELTPRYPEARKIDYDYKIVIGPEVLFRYKSDLAKLMKVHFQPRRYMLSDSTINLVVYGEFFADSRDPILSFGLDFAGGMLINNTLVSYDREFYNFVGEFLPASERSGFRRNLINMYIGFLLYRFSILDSD